MAKLIYTRDEKFIIYKEKKDEIYKYIEKMDIDKETFKYLNEIENLQIEGLNLEDLYLYETIPLYYFEKPTIYLNLKHVFLCFLLIKNIVENIDEEILIESDDEVFLDISREIFNLKCDEISNNNIPSNTQSLRDKKYKLFLRTLRGIKNYIKFKSNLNKRDNVLVISNVMNINLLKKDTKNEFIDTQIGSVVEDLKNKVNVLNLQCVFNFNMLDKSLSYKKEYIPFEFFMLYKKLKGRKLVKDNLIKNKLEKINSLDFTYKGYNLKNIILKYVLNNLENRYMSDLIEILCAEKVIKKYNIKKCIVTDEGDRPRCFITAGNRENIETYAVQHGIINEVSPAYMINSKYSGIIPKCTFVWGEKYKTMLKNGSNIYRNNKIEVVGQVRTDLLVNYLEKQSNTNDKVKILYATQYFKDLLVPATDILFDALNLMEKEYEIVVKLHPADQYYDIYKSMIEEKGIKNVKIIKDGDLYELLAWCDVVVSVHSTVVVEGALLNKPSICIVLPKYNDAGGFIKDGLSMGVREKNELQQCLDNIHKYEFSKKFNEYIHNNFYKSDGKVTKRITTTMINLTKE
ncbi:hypothetical protein [Clostridium ganghwense]|uniref:Uncharacterized protein n=1 Tax=Clostridium ganghwense TaxID=312089 RepID=A0ABT4CN83_9CLOT|nr:hypothetical protein [Clostridium ganghwense]MCY6370502.1 hypothetical protein [Clostridium ganghwense]